MSMCVCTYYVYMGVRMFICTSVCARTYVCMYVCMCTYVYVCMYVRMYMYVCVCSMHVCIHVCMYVRECGQKFLDWPPGARTANGTALCQ
jgi:hypothetical protein